MKMEMSTENTKFKINTKLMRIPTQAILNEKFSKRNLNIGELNIQTYIDTGHRFAHTYIHMYVYKRTVEQSQSTKPNRLSWFKKCQYLTFTNVDN